MCQESTAELKLADVLEEFVFLVFKYQKLEKKVDYFHVSEDVEEEEAKSQRGAVDTDDVVVLHNTSHKERSKKGRKNSGTQETNGHSDSKYQMSTVIEDSNEDEFEDSPVRSGRALSRKDKDSNEGEDSGLSPPAAMDGFGQAVAAGGLTAGMGFDVSPCSADGTQQPLLRMPKIKVFATPQSTEPQPLLVNSMPDDSEKQTDIIEPEEVLSSATLFKNPLENYHSPKSLEKTQAFQFPAMEESTVWKVNVPVFNDYVCQPEQLYQDPLMRLPSAVMVSSMPVSADNGDVSADILGQKSIVDSMNHDLSNYLPFKMMEPEPLSCSEAFNEKVSTMPDHMPAMQQQVSEGIDIVDVFNTHDQEQYCHPLNNLLTAAIRSSGVKLPEVCQVKSKSSKMIGMDLPTQTSNCNSNYTPSKELFFHKPASTQTPKSQPAANGMIRSHVTPGHVASTTTEEVYSKTTSTLKIEVAEEGQDHELHHHDSNVRIIEKLESRIIKIIKETKMQIQARKIGRGGLPATTFTPNSSVPRKSPLAGRGAEINPPTSANKSASGKIHTTSLERYNTTGESFSNRSAPKRHTTFGGKPMSSTKVPTSNLSFELMSASNPNRRPPKKQSVNVSMGQDRHRLQLPEEKTSNNIFITTSRGAKESRCASRSQTKNHNMTTQVREVAKNNISLSFNLDFSKFINNDSKSCKKVQGRSSLKEKESQSQNIRLTPQMRLTTKTHPKRDSVGDRTASIINSDRSMSRDSAKLNLDRSATQPTGQHDSRGNNNRIKDLLGRMRHAAGSTASKPTVPKEIDRQTKQRGSEGTVNSMISTKKTPQPFQVSSKLMGKQSDSILRRRGEPKSREGTASKQQSFESSHEARVSMLSEIQHKLRLSLMKS